MISCADFCAKVAQAMEEGNESYARGAGLTAPLLLLNNKGKLFSFVLMHYHEEGITTQKI